MNKYTVVSKNGQTAFQKLSAKVTLRLLESKPSGLTVWEVTSITNIDSLLDNNCDFSSWVKNN